MDFARLSRPRRLLPVLCLCAAAVTPIATARRAAPVDDTAGARLLQAQLPAGSLLRQTGCEGLVRAVRLATLSHHREASVILSAALAADEKTPGTGQRACGCVTQLFRAAVNAAPDHASALLETAEAACPECADDLARMLGRMEDKNVVADPKDYAADRRAASGDPRDLSDRNYNGMGFSSQGNDGTGNGSDHGGGTGTGDGFNGGTGTGDGFNGGTGNSTNTGTGNSTGTGNGSDPGPGFGTGTGSSVSTSTVGADSSTGNFGTGLGAGFPGSPAFSGSSPGGGFALPLPNTSAVTSVVNG